MLNGHIPGLTDANAGCNTSKTGLCKDCPLFVSMPFETRDARTGEIIASGSVFDCVHVWTAMGSWDGANRTLGVHAAVCQQTNETVKRQDQLLGMVTGAAEEKRLEHAAGEY